jgi:Tol biopolymer transport system component
MEPLEDRRLLSAVMGNGSSSRPSVSSNGRYVAFESQATNLVAGDTNAVVDIFRKDTQTGATARASTDSAGTQGNGLSNGASISANGRYVAFGSDATNLVAGDTNGVYDVFVKDTQTGATTRVSTSSAGAQANAASYNPKISGDGRYVAFDSGATNLVAGDTNAKSDIFVKDLQTGATTRASTTSGNGQASCYSYSPSISADGRYVAFQSNASNLVAGDTSNTLDIFRKDTQTGAVIRANTDSAGTVGNAHAYAPTISGDGRYVAFRTNASNLVAGDANGLHDIFVKDAQTGATTRASTSSAGVEANAWSDAPSLSSDGRYVAFQTDAGNLVTGDTNASTDVFLKDRQTGTTTRPSTGCTGNQASGYSSYPSISADARWVAFSSSAANLVAGDTNGVYDVFVKDLQTGETACVSSNSEGSHGTETVGLYDPAGGTFYLRNANAAGLADAAFAYGPPGSTWLPLVGDWNGDGADTIGLYDPSAGVFYLRNANSAGNADLAFGYGHGGLGWRPLVGDWNGDGTDTVGLYDPSAGTFYLRDWNNPGNANVAFGYGPAGTGWQPLVGDWNGDALDTAGVYDPAGGAFYLRNTNSAGVADLMYGYGPGSSGWTPMAGDWNGNGTDTVGLYAPTTGVFYLRNSHQGGAADLCFDYGPAGASWRPAAGDWNGSGSSLAASAGEVADAGPIASLTEADLQPIVAQAIADWADLGLATWGRPPGRPGSGWGIADWASLGLAADQLEALVDVRFVIADLPGAQLGLAERDTIFLDLNAAGHGWFIDPTPASDEEFIAGAAGRLTAISPAAVDRIDLLTAVSHELGHTLGLGDLDASIEALMSGTLESGVRRGP